MSIHCADLLFAHCTSFGGEGNVAQNKMGFSFSNLAWDGATFLSGEEADLYILADNNGV
jgi:hypothetical protein